MDEVLNDISHVDSWRSANEFETKYEKTFHKMIDNFTPEEKSRIDVLLLDSIKNGYTKVLECVAIRILEKRKLIDWKNRPNLVDSVVDAVIQSALAESENNSKHFTAFMGKFIEILINHHLLEQYCTKLFEIIREAYNNLTEPNAAIHNAALHCIVKFPWKDKTEYIPKMVNFLLAAAQQCPDADENAWVCTNSRMAIPMMFRQLNGQTVHKTVLKEMTEIFRICLNHDWQSEQNPSKQNLAYKLLEAILDDYLGNFNTDPELVRPMMEGIKELWECGDSDLQRKAGNIITAMAGHADIIGDDTSVLLETYLKNKDANIGAKLVDIYKNQPDLVLPLLPRFVKSLEESDDVSQMLLIQMFTEVAKRNPEAITSEAIKAMAGKLKDNMLCLVAIMFLDSVAEKNPTEVMKYEEQILRMYNNVENAVYTAGSVFVKIAISEEKKKRYLELFFSRLNSISGAMQIAIVGNIRQLGLTCPHLLSQYRDQIEKLKAQPALSEMCQSLLDIMEGRTLEQVSKDVGDQKKNLNQLDTRVTNNEEEIGKVKVEVNHNKDDIGKVKDKVEGQGQRIDDLKQVVDDTVQRVDGLERRTLSHAPSWSREVAALLSPTSDSDWRLLGARLGYAGDDMRAWATQPEPCLSLLDDWFSRQNTREATRAVRAALVEMNRSDASEVIDRALKSVQYVISEEDTDPPSPPPVFLSYQWGRQGEVKLLRRHLGLAGYASWMDVGQMGGGDKLFSKIDSGIRSAKVVICCVSQKYSESQNCNREVNLCTVLGKPMIPLLMEEMAWPPAGSMGPIFGEFIYVKFFQNAGVSSTDQRYWPVEKFTELLLQLRYYIAPQSDAIPDDSPYLNWWNPPEEIIVIEQKSNTNNNQIVAVTEENKQSEISTLPEVFISYQWDKQEEIKRLYSCLTGHGFKCWLDILQMGGGDGLYEKIDHGIRNCRVVVSCVTIKYAKSANCRREVSLTDALKKPLILLLLEEISWPPEGPMGPILTQLLYINFAQPGNEVQTMWNRPELDQLLQKISVFSTPNPANKISEISPSVKDPKEIQPSSENSTSQNKKSQPLSTVNNSYNEERSKMASSNLVNDSKSLKNSSKSRTVTQSSCCCVS